MLLECNKIKIIVIKYYNYYNKIIVNMEVYVCITYNNDNKTY